MKISKKSRERFFILDQLKENSMKFTLVNEIQGSKILDRHAGLIVE